MRVVDIAVEICVVAGKVVVGWTNSVPPFCSLGNFPIYREYLPVTERISQNEGR